MGRTAGSTTKAKKLTKSQLAREAESQLRENTVEILRKYWRSLDTGLERGDPKIIKIVAEMYAYNKAPGGTIFNQNNIVMAGKPAVDAPRVRSFDAIVNKLEDKTQVRAALAAPLAQPDEDEDDDILDGDADDDDEVNLEEFARSEELENIREVALPVSYPDVRRATDR